MIKLMELLHTIKGEENSNLVPVDNWKVTDVMYLEDIGFKNDGMYYYALKKPEIKISYKKGEGFILDDETNKNKTTFKKFRELENHFANYKQKWANQPYL